MGNQNLLIIPQKIGPNQGTLCTKFEKDMSTGIGDRAHNNREKLSTIRKFFLSEKGGQGTTEDHLHSGCLRTFQNR